MNKEAWIQCALDKGMESFEIYESLNSSKELTWFDNKMDTFVSSSILGTSIRGIVDGNVANMALEHVDDSQMESVIDSLMEQAKTITTKEKDTLRKPETIETVEYKRVWIHPSMQQVQEVMKTIEKKAMAYDSRIQQVAYLGWEESKGYRQITNSYGIDVMDEDEIQYLAMSVVAQDGDDIKDKTNIELVYDLSVFDIDGFVEKVCKEAILKLNASSLPSQTCPVIFEKKAMTSLFGAFTGLFSGDLIYKGISCLKGKENTQIFSDLITIVDNPRNTEALSVATFDDEGCPTYEKKLVDKGIFRLALQSTKSAIRNHCQSTGNGFKSGYASSVSVQPLNCNIEPGSHSLEELMMAMKDGLVITDLAGLHAGIDFVSTNFSLQCSGYLVKNGKRDKSVTLITVAGNFLNLMKDVNLVGNDLEWKYHTIVCPSIYFNKCAISGE